MKVQKLLLICLIISFTARTAGAVESCIDYRTRMINDVNAKKKTSQNEDKDGSTELMQKCVLLSGNTMRNLYKNQKHNENWNTFIEGSEECIASSEACANENQSDLNAKKVICNEKRTAALRCDAAAYLINVHDLDWNSPEDVKTETVKGGNPEIKCTGSGIETLDYKACVKFIKNGNIMDVAQAAIQTGQQLIYQDKAMSAQANAAKSPESATAGLKALHDGVRGQQEIMTQRAVLDTGKLAALAAFYSEMPSHNDLLDDCKKYTLPNSLKNNTRGDSASDPDDPVQICKTTVQSGFAFLDNEQAKDKMKAKLAAVGINVASDIVMADLMAKRAGDINNAITNVENFKPIDPLAPSLDNVQTTFCQQNPGDPKCLTGGLEKTFDAMSDNVITFGDGGTGTSYNNSNRVLENTAGTTNAVNSSLGRNTTPGIGSVISHADQKNGLENTVAAATVTKGSIPTGGGGSGGGGSGGGSGGGGGGGAPAGNTQAGSAASTALGKAPTYGGGGGTLSMMGGLGINKSKSAAKDDTNPFGKLFNKDASKSGEVDFGRSPASLRVGTKADNIFEMISKRYTNINSDKRLLEYEMTK